MARIMKGVSFNSKDKVDMKLLRFTEEQGAFSKYIKRLLERELINREIPNVKQIEIVNKTPIDQPKQINLPEQSNEIEMKGKPNPNKFL